MSIAKALFPLVLGAAAFMAACTSSDSESLPDSSPDSQNTNGANDTENTNGANNEPGVELRLEVPATARIGETVPLRLRLKNVSTDRLEFLGGGIPSHDFVVVDQYDSVVWFWRTGSDDALVEVQLDPGEEEVYTGDWIPGDEVEPGDYRVRGLFYLEPGSGTLETEPASITLVQ